MRPLPCYPRAQSGVNEYRPHIFQYRAFVRQPMLQHILLAPPHGAMHDLLRGCITTGLLSSLQGQDGLTLNQRTLKRSLQGGLALAAGAAAARAIRQDRYTHAILTVVAGAIGVATVECF